MRMIPSTLLAACWLAIQLAAIPASTLTADQPVVIGSLTELPPRSYAIDRPPSELLDDPQAFAELARQFEQDLLDDLKRYRFEDRSATRRYYQTLARLAMLDGRFELALERIEHARAYEDKPAGRLTLGLAQIAAIAAMQAETDQAEEVFRARFDQLLSDLPLEEAETELRAMRSNAAFLTESFLRGWVEAQIDLAAQDHTLSMLQVNRLVSARADLELVPYGGIIGERINHHLDGWPDDGVDIWAERQIELPDAEHLTPVVVAIWDSGMDTDLFSGQLFVDPSSPPDHPVHGLAFDIENQAISDMLNALGDMPDELPECPFEAMADLRAGLESPAALALRQLLASIEPARVRTIMNALSHCQSHYHGTHVAGIAADGNPAIRLLNLRTTFDMRTPPAPLTEQRRVAMLNSWQQMTEYMNLHGVRVANMSWGFGPLGIERILEMTGMGDSAEERRAMAREIYDNGRQALTEYFSSAPNVLFIAAAMNADSDNRFMEQIPASIELPNLLTVGAVDRAGREAPFTSYGKVDIYANGVEVESYVPGGQRVPISGTSMAAPQVANLAAKLLALQPNLTTAELRQLILDGADEHEIGEGRSIRLLNPTRSVALLQQGTQAQAAEMSADPAARLHALADEIMRSFLTWNPETVTQLGLPLDLHHALEDRSPDALEARRAQIVRWLERLALIDPEALENPRDRVLTGLIRHELDSAAAQRVCRQEYWNLSQMNGWHIQYPRLAEIQPVANAAAREAAIKRYAALPAYIVTEIGNLRAGLEQGYAVPRVVIERVLGQLDKLLEPPAKESPFAILAANARQAGGDESEIKTFDQQVEALIAERINPALEQFRDFLANEYQPRDTFGVDALPDGEACYAARLRTSTTLSLSPREVHELGIREMAGIYDEILELGGRLFDLHAVPEILDHYRTHPELLYSNRDEILQVARAAVDRARDEMSAWFGILPRADVIVEPVPAFMEADVALARYRQAAEDGSRPGTFLINLYQPERQPRGTTEAIAFHEAIPGHHMQIAIQQELKGVHMIARYARTTAFTEGWALYTERLADEMGLYSSDLDRLGMLTTQAFRAARLVVDTGIHALGWDRQQAVDYMVANTGQPRHDMEVEVDRYIIRPAQASAYMTGMLEIRRLRELAETRLGKRFDIRTFHDRVLENGAVTLPMLSTKIETWINSSGTHTQIQMPK
jgi:uncharacterized protein (DUF885 family)